MRTLNDEPTLLDRLQRKKLVAEVGQVIATCEPPQVFAIHGDWGMGKTSFLHQVQLYLTGWCPQAGEEELEDALAPLEMLPRLRFLHLIHTSVPPEAAARLRHKLPGLEINGP